MLKIFTTPRFEKRLKIFIEFHPDLVNTALMFLELMPRLKELKLLEKNWKQKNWKQI
ncbi:MAG: hypothetical protein US35_C0012G0004 [Parcubacteria group bacterium GW2011_GWA2_37_10]|nr:MAG: hypothetical protein US35_C0012G0004 [Parcubacteria group bacterium GW2011_GWA2_37_10]